MLPKRAGDREAKKARTLLKTCGLHGVCSLQFNASNYSRNWQNTDFMRLSLNKLSYMRVIGGMEYYPDIFLPFSRHRPNLENKTEQASKKEEHEL